MDEINTNVVGLNELLITDAINTSLLKLIIKKSVNTTGLYPSLDLLPNADLKPKGSNDSNKLIIYVDTNSKDNPSALCRQYIFDIKPLQRLNDVYDEFIIKSVYDENNKVKMIIKVIRKVEVINGFLTILNKPYEEFIDYEDIDLFLGKNYIYTNYSDVEINLSYVKINNFNYNYLNNSTFYKHLTTLNQDIQSEVEHALQDVYFKNYLIETEAGLNVSANNINVNCIVNKDNKFNIDSNGFLKVNNAEVLENLKVKNLEYETSKVISNIKYKKDLEKFSNGLNLIINSDIYKYRYLKENEESKKHIGLIVGKDYKTPKEVIDDANEGIDLYSMIAITWNAIKELNEKINFLKGEK